MGEPAAEAYALPRQQAPAPPQDLRLDRPATTGPPPADYRHHHRPLRDWSGHELAIRLGVKPRTMLTQLREWALLGFFTHTDYGTYRLNTPPDNTSPTTAPDP
jgi:hypothetical protein